MTAERRKWEQTINKLITKDPIKRELLVNYAIHYTNNMSQEMFDNMRDVDKNFLPMQLTVINNLDDITYDYSIENEVEFSFNLTYEQNVNIDFRLYAVRMFLINELMFKKIAINFLVSDLKFDGDKVTIKSKIKYLDD